ncbi:Sorting nexin 6 [Strongyloides ratti]|uniref:Sorting nexin 6 n=1 Tax=Strongyloides ratti TaxID=34506 RepID=A0A090LMW1_STRRB|nr:Sorting nexin 6 [Strongyloides ratti]CEF68865.1 Sorting nexin 6 [Strongyloides ratti]
MISEDNSLNVSKSIEHPLDSGTGNEEDGFHDVLDDSNDSTKKENISSISNDENYEKNFLLDSMPAQLSLEETGNEKDAEEGFDERNHRTEEFTMDGESDVSLVVNISDALSEKYKVKYTIYTRTNWNIFAKSEMSVVREHSEFIWLHNCLEENKDYAGFIIPQAPPKPDFDASREKLQKLGEGQATMTKEEFKKMKQELEQEYLATFKKTVATHEMFLRRLASHPVFRNDKNFKVFLEYENDLSVRNKNKKEMVGSFLKKMTQSADEILLSGQKDVDDFFEQEKNFLVEYYTHIKEAVNKSDRVAYYRKNVADSYVKIANDIIKFSLLEGAAATNSIVSNPNHSWDTKFIGTFADTLEKLKKIESRVATDEELKEADTLRYFCRETQAAKDLLYRRTRCLANYEAANKNLERARARNKDIARAEKEQEECCKKFEDLSEVAKKELQELKVRKVKSFKKNLCDLVEIEIKHAKSQLTLLQTALTSLKDDASTINV